MQPQSLEDAAAADEHGPGDNRLSSRIAHARAIAKRTQRDIGHRIGSAGVIVENPPDRAAHADDLQRGDD